MPRDRSAKRKAVEKGKELEDMIERLAEENGWRVEKRKKYGDRILDLILSKGGTVFIVQSKNTDQAMPSDVSQARKDYEEYVRWLLEEKLGLSVVPVLVSKSFSEGARGRARSYGVMLYTVEELEGLLSGGRRRESWR
ncbi:MAG: restriction endonuclease [Conexivisphaera sp.]